MMQKMTFISSKNHYFRASRDKSEQKVSIYSNPSLQNAHSVVWCCLHLTNLSLICFPNRLRENWLAFSLAPNPVNATPRLFECVITPNAPKREGNMRRFCLNQEGKGSQHWRYLTWEPRRRALHRVQKLILIQRLRVVRASVTFN